MLILDRYCRCTHRSHRHFMGTLPADFPLPYWVLPKSAETIGAMRRLIQNQPPDINSVVVTSAIFALVCYIGTVIYLIRKDY
jgi:hypothetical protein